MRNVRAWPPTIGEELHKWIQCCCAMFLRSQNKNVGIYWLKSLTNFKLCTTDDAPNDMQQHSRRCANRPSM